MPQSEQYFIYDGNERLPIDIETGRIGDSQEKSTFMYYKNGFFHVMDTDTACKGLQSLLAGDETTMRLGKSVAQKCYRYKRRRTKYRKPACRHRHCCCCASAPKRHCSTKSNLDIFKQRSRSSSRNEHISVPVVTEKVDASIQVDDFLSTDNNKLTHDTVKQHNERLDDEIKMKKKKVQPLEVVIDEDTVEMLRNYLLNNSTDFDLYRFDCDHKYKVELLYSLNPFVRIERSSLINRMLNVSDTESQQSQTDESVIEFAGKLGLAHITKKDSMNPGRYKMRRRTAISKHSSTVDSNAHEIDKENITFKKLHGAKKIVKNENKFFKHSNSSNESNEKVEKDILNTKHNNKIKDYNNLRERDPEKNTSRLSLSDDSDFESKNTPGKLSKTLIKMSEKNAQTSVSRSKKESTLPKETLLVRPNFKLTKRSSVAPGREYTNMEDHTIVAWIKQNDRDRMVNGNAVWKELEQNYEQLTGQSRSWHSLRNRYLRYILPSLGSLGLSQSEISKLRAQAAMGSIKLRKKLSSSATPRGVESSERAVSAWSLRARAAPTPDRSTDTSSTTSAVAAAAAASTSTRRRQEGTARRGSMPSSPRCSLRSSDKETSHRIKRQLYNHN